MKGLGVRVVSYATWNELQAELRALRAERDGMLVERKDTLDLSRRRLDESQAEIARLTEAAQRVVQQVYPQVQHDALKELAEALDAGR